MPITDDDMAEFMKKRGIKPYTPAPGEPPPTAANPMIVPKTLPDMTPAPPEMMAAPPTSPRERAFERGVEQGFGDIAVDVNRTAKNIPGVSSARDVAAQAPWLRDRYGDIRRLTEEPSAGSAQDFGRLTGGNLPFLLAPGGVGAESTLGAVAARASNLAAPSTASRIVGAARGLGRYFDPIISGGASGALANPEHPMEGAASGAAAGKVGKGMEDILRSRSARGMAGHAMASAATGAAAHFMMGASIPASVAWGLAIPGLRWTRFPSGGSVHRVGSTILDSLGAAVGYIDNPAFTGRVASKLDPEGDVGGALIETGKAVPGAVKDVIDYSYEGQR